ncbi:MAG: hypothetical protein H0X62_07250 [Bacteroidetes bacterium]|nr:hypothetical protein [Bacteroidota bacterium]
MKYLVFLTFSLFLFSCTQSQQFEGKIVYKNSIKSKLPNMSDERFEEMMGINMEYRIKNGYYKSVTDGKLVQWQLYNHGKNRIYTKMSNSESVLWNDCAVMMDEVLKTEINKGVMEILGYECDELILTCKSGVQKYYYNPVLAVNPDDYKNHHYANWSAFTEKSNSFPLKMIIENDQFVLTTIATKISPEKIDKKIFELPAGAVLEKSPY